MKTVYLDYSATTPLDPLVLAAMQPYFGEQYGNASSVHSFGRTAKTALEESREEIAHFIGARADELVFTSGGTESNNAAIKGVSAVGLRRGRNEILVSAIEHHAVLQPAEALRNAGFKLEIIPVESSGIIDLDYLRTALSNQTSFVSVMYANNEIGTLQPIAQISEEIKKKRAVFHTDAVQAVGKIPVNVSDLGIDLLSLTAHKIYGPKGIGALYIRKGIEMEPFLKGGGQEGNRRAGTENVPLAVGFAKAVALCAERMDQDRTRAKILQGLLREKLKAKFRGILFNGHPKQSLPNIVSVSFNSAVRELDGDAIIMGMDLEGVAVTSGSACSSGSLEASHVLLAIGRDEKTAKATVRFSLGRRTTEEDILYAVDALKKVIARMDRTVNSAQSEKSFLLSQP